MKNKTTITEPLRINDAGNHSLEDYNAFQSIALSGALLLGPSIETDLNTSIKIINKKTNQEFDRMVLKAFANPTRPYDDKIQLKEKYFNPKNHFLKVETKEASDNIHFLLYFSPEV